MGRFELKINVKKDGICLTTKRPFCSRPNMLYSKVNMLYIADRRTIQRQFTTFKNSNSLPCIR